MKYSIFALIFSLTTCSVQPVMAALPESYNSPECVYSMEAGDAELRELALEVLLPGATKSQANRIKGLDIKDTLVATQIVVCEGKTPDFARKFIGLQP